VSIGGIVMGSKYFHMLAGESPGLKSDAHIIANALAGQYEVAVNIHSKWNFAFHINRILLKAKRLFGSKTAVGVYLEDIRPRWLSAFSVSILIPNQEWVRPSTASFLSTCDEVWCKTKYAQTLFENLGCNTKFIGFSSADRYVPEISKNFESYIHVQGRSGSKGTATIVQAWKKHRHWPMLTLVTRDVALLSITCPNIRVITDFLTEVDLNKLMNVAGVHLCTSETEGFGHSINEALSTGALVISTDAPPMNELVQPQFGLLVPFSSSSAAGFGERFKVDVNDLVQTIEETLVLTQVEKQKMGQLARAAYLQGRNDFQVAILKAAGHVEKSSIT
jgi:glycosyltransferase involved in cell wall biosynthesis